MGFNHVQTATLFKILNDMTDCIIVKPNLGYKMDQWTKIWNENNRFPFQLCIYIYIYRERERERERAHEYRPIRISEVTNY